MNPRLLSLGIVLPVLLKLHLTIAAGGLAVTVFLPAFIVAALVIAVVVVTWLAARQIRGFRSSPYLRNRHLAGA